MFELEQAWQWRQNRGLWAGTEALRAFHGPGEGRGRLSNLAIDRFGDHYWITHWQTGGKGNLDSADLSAVIRFIEGKNAVSAVLIERPERGTPEPPRVVLGTPPAQIVVQEQDARFAIRFQNTRHPGLFLDHAPLRAWLRGRMNGLRVLNTFAYTGSLSVACGIGGARHVTSLDLAASATRWAEENWNLNGLAPEAGRFISGDVFEWLPRLKRSGESFDCVILDPPSFSHGKKGSFSTAKDLARLHALAFDVLAPQGIVVTSINSAEIPWPKYEAELARAAGGRRFSILSRIDLPETFPTPLGDGMARYLKGFVLRLVGD